MNIIGIGPMEMGVIAVIALLIFGPGKLPEVMGQAGKLVRDFRQMTAGFTGEFEKTMAEAREITSGITNEIGGVTKQVNSVTNSVKKDLAGTKKTTTTSTAAKSSTTKTSTAAKSTAAAKSTSATKSTTAAKSTSAAKSTTAAKPAIPVASREDPTAGFSLFEPEPVERPRRTRIASPAAIADVLPREQVAEPATDSAASANGAEPDSPLERARQRRRNAGYGRVHA